MIEYTPLSAEGKARILNGFMKPRLSRTQSVEQPKIVLVGAQPGAGKSKAASLAKSELRQEGGYIHVDADIMRALIPAPEGVVYSSEQTQKDAGALAISVRNSAKENRRNIVEEGTFRNAASIS
ncbi:zeta toxin family protein, partial [Neisseria gonorrhoeae]